MAEIKRADALRLGPDRLRQPTPHVSHGVGAPTEAIRINPQRLPFMI
jgi:hypothetical protein